jgi:hypothetical protein
MSLKAGTVSDFGGSMAEAIETAFAAELLALKGTTLPEFATEERRMLFCAIAQGVLAHLHDHDTSLKVRLDGTYSAVTGHVDVDLGGP